MARRSAEPSLELSYVGSTFEAFDAPDESYDAVVFNLSLHHLGDLTGAVDKARRLLKPGGRIVCNEFAYDRLDEATATWLFQAEQQLYLSGLLAEGLGEVGAEGDAIAALRSNWMRHYVEHALHGYDAMISALEKRFRRERFAWAPYLFVRVSNRITNAPPEREAALVRFLRGLEAHFIETGRIQAVGFRFVGTPFAAR